MDPRGLVDFRLQEELSVDRIEAKNLPHGFSDMFACNSLFILVDRAVLNRSVNLVLRQDTEAFAECRTPLLDSYLVTFSAMEFSNFSVMNQSFQVSGFC